MSDKTKVEVSGGGFALGCMLILLANWPHSGVSISRAIVCNLTNGEVPCVKPEEAPND